MQRHRACGNLDGAGEARSIRGAGVSPRPHGTGLGDRSAIEAGHDLLVRRLVEVAVGHPDAEERLDGADADQLIGHPGQLLCPPSRRDGDGQHDAGRPLGPDHLTRGASGRAGRDPVIDHDHGTAREARPRPVVSEAQSPTVELDSLASLDHRELCLADTGGFDHLGVDDARPVFADRPHGQLRFERHAELAYEDDVEWRVEGQCDLQGHRDTAAGQPDDDDIGAAEALQPPREDPPGLGTIREHLLHLRVQGPHGQ